MQFSDVAKDVGRPHSVASCTTGAPSPGPYSSAARSPTPDTFHPSRPATTDPYLPTDLPDRAWQGTGPQRPQSEQGHRPRPGARTVAAAGEGDRKPRTTLAAITSLGQIKVREANSGPVVPYVGAGFPSLFGPKKPASHSPCESALHTTTLTSHPIPELKTVSKVEAALERDKARLSARYNTNVGSRMQQLPESSATYTISLPDEPQNMKYSKLDRQPDVWRFTKEGEDEENGQMAISPRGSRGRKALKKGEIEVHKQEIASKRGHTVQYNLKRLEVWFKLMDINHTGEVTVRKLIVGMLKHQELLDLFYLLKDGGQEASETSMQDRPKIGQLTKEDMTWVKDVLSDLDQDGNSSMDWPEFVDFFRKTGLLLEYKTRDDLNASMLGETSMESMRKKKQEEQKVREGKWFTEERRKARLAGRSGVQKDEKSNCEAAQTT